MLNVDKHMVDSKFCLLVYRNKTETDRSVNRSITRKRNRTPMRKGRKELKVKNIVAQSNLATCSIADEVCPSRPLVDSSRDLRFEISSG